jgi:ATP-binding cassette subfamily B protein
MVLNLVIGVLPLGFVIGISVAIERVAEAGRGIWGGVLLAVGLAVVSLLLQSVLSPFQAAFAELISRRVDGACARRLMRAALTEAPVGLLEQPDVLDKTGDARRGLVEYLTTPGAAVAGLIALIARYAQLAGAVVITGVVLGPVAALVITAAALVARFGERGIQARYSLLASRSAAARRKAYYILDTGSSLAAAKEIRVLGTLPWWRERGERDSGSYLHPLWHARRRIRLAPVTVYSLVVLAGTAAVLVMLRDTADRGGLSVLGLSLALQAVLIVLRFGVYFPEADYQTLDGMRARDSMLEIERAAAQRSPGRLRPGGRQAGQAPVSGIAFEKVSFAYPGSGRNVLRELDPEFPAGTSTAIVGLNGAGQTTPSGPRLPPAWFPGLSALISLQLTESTAIRTTRAPRRTQHDLGQPRRSAPRRRLAPPTPETSQAVPLRSPFASAGPGGAQVDEVAADRGVAPNPGLVLRAVVENHRAAGIPARFEARPQLVLLGDQDVA